MGLRRLKQSNARFYLQYTITSGVEDQQMLEAVVVAKDDSSTLKVRQDRNEVLLNILVQLTGEKNLKAYV